MTLSRDRRQKWSGPLEIQRDRERKSRAIRLTKSGFKGERDRERHREREVEEARVGGARARRGAHESN